VKSNLGSRIIPETIEEKVAEASRSTDASDASEGSEASRSADASEASEASRSDRSAWWSDRLLGLFGLKK
jgi:hypothetical protein